jgi:hypothetical protein
MGLGHLRHFNIVRVMTPRGVAKVGRRLVQNGHRRMFACFDDNAAIRARVNEPMRRVDAAEISAVA